jgi:hypothetical protein
MPGRELAHDVAARQGLEAATGRVPEVGVQRGTVDRQVADFARRPGGAPVQPPAQDGGQAEADAQPDQDEIVGAAAAPSARSAIAARFTSFSITTGLCQASVSASSAPSCQAGRFTASLGSRSAGRPRPGCRSPARSAG